MDMTQYSGNESKYLKATDLQGKRLKVKIESVQLLEFDDDEKGKHKKPAIKLMGKEKRLVMNATNVQEMIAAFGKDSDDWAGKEVILSTKFYSQFGREGIVVTPFQPVPDDMNDDIQF